MTFVTRDKEKITIDSLRHPQVASDFVSAILEARSQGIESFHCDFRLSNSKSIFPNVACPLAGYISYFRAEQIRFSRGESELGTGLFERKLNAAADAAVDATQIFNPLKVRESEKLLKTNVLNKGRLRAYHF